MDVQAGVCLCCLQATDRVSHVEAHMTVKPRLLKNMHFQGHEFRETLEANIVYRLQKKTMD